MNNYEEAMIDRILEFEAKVKELERENKELQEKLLLSESQNYCKICGNILDGYIPPTEDLE